MEELKKRLYSLLWRTAGMASTFLLGEITNLISSGEINIPRPYTVFIGLMVGEITKFANNYFSKKNVNA